MLLNMGPFAFAPGETQEIVVAVVAGVGLDRLSRITAMRFIDRAAKQSYGQLFAVVRPPAVPKTNAIAMDREIILEWGSDLAQVKETEEKIIAGNYAFEGYNVYQLPSRTASLSEGVKIATFDVANGVRRIVDEVFDPNSGLIIPVILQRGNDTGIQRHFHVTRDTLSSNRGLNNGQEYYFAVTAYNYSSHPRAFPKSLESEARILTVKPQIPFGVKTPSKYGDTLQVTHTQGHSEGVVHATVINPLAGTGDSYEVRFDTTAGATTWYVRNASKDKIVIAGLNENQAHSVEGGIWLSVSGTPIGLKREDMFSTGDQNQWGWDWISGTRFITWANADGLGLEAFRGAVGWDSPHRRFGNGIMAVRGDQLATVEIRFAETDNLGNFIPADTNVSYAYRYGQSFDQPPARPEFARFIINAEGGFAYQDYTQSMPLAVYDVDADPPRRLAVGFLENNASGGSVNGKYWPPNSSIADNVSPNGPREWLFIFN
ncbi:MAG: hypothetical protein ONA90_09960, partial [candidate division KSB1 bacterium]|nr:hypothetical protein [candidate division KSB1 bacterium]